MGAYSLISLTPRPGRTWEDVLVWWVVRMEAPRHTTPINSYNMADICWWIVCAPAAASPGDVETSKIGRNSYLTLNHHNQLG